VGKKGEKRNLEWSRAKGKELQMGKLDGQLWYTHGIPWPIIVMVGLILRSLSSSRGQVFWCSLGATHPKMTQKKLVLDRPETIIFTVRFRHFSKFRIIIVLNLYHLTE